MEKRKRNRLQSSWAKQRCVSRPVRGRPAVSSSSNFIFQETDPSAEHQKPKPEKIITKGGKYVISNGELGESSIHLYPNFIPLEETKWMFHDLEAHIPWEEKNIKVQGQYHRQPRLTAWFGDFPYTYSGLTLQPFQWSPLLNLLRERIDKETGLSFNSMLANLYRNEKDSVMDDLSLSEIIRIPLPSGSLLIMSGATQSDWQHRVAKEYHSRGPRINLTFRNITPCGI